LTETKLKPDTPFVHPDCEIKDATFGKYVEIGRGSRVAHSSLDDYSYCDRFADIANASVGKFSNIASFVRLGATDHPMEKANDARRFYEREGMSVVDRTEERITLKF